MKQNAKNKWFAVPLVLAIMLVLLSTVVSAGEADDAGAERGQRSTVSGVQTMSDDTAGADVETAEVPGDSGSGENELQTFSVLDGSCGEGVSWELTLNEDNTTYTLSVSGSGAMQDYTWSWWSDYPSTPWKSYTEKITKLIIGEGVTYIGNNSFPGFAITELTLPEGVTGIGTDAFGYCESLKTVTLPATLTTIGDAAFEECASIESFVVPDSVTSIGINNFGGWVSLKNLYISGNVSYALGGAMTGLWGEDYTISELCADWPNVAVTFGEGSPYEIEGGVLYNGTVAEAVLDYKATEIVIRNGTTKIEEAAFNFPFAEGDYYYDILEKRETEKVTLPSSVKTIGAFAFKNCPLKEINLSDVENIEECAFLNTDITEADLTNVKTIGNMAFENCTVLADVVWPTDLEAFTESKYETSDYYKGRAFKGCSSLKSVAISGTVAEIPTDTFYDCAALETVYIGESVVTIGDYSFFGCPSVETIELSEGLQKIGDCAFFLIDTNSGDMDTFVNSNPKLSSINIPSTVEYLGIGFLAGVKPNGETALIFEGNTLPEFAKEEDENALMFISQNGMNRPSVYYPAGAKDVYTADDSALLIAALLKDSAGDDNQEQGYALSLPEAAAVCPGNTVPFAVESTLPVNAVLELSTDDPAVASVRMETASKNAEQGDAVLTSAEGSYVNGSVEGISTGTAVITAKITVNGVTIASDTCTVTVSHSYVDTVTEPDCTERGYTTHICSVCGDSYTDQYVDAKGHAFEWVIDREATEKEKGSKHEECTVCGYKKEAVMIPATGSPTVEKPTTSDPDTASKDNSSQTKKNSPQTGDFTDWSLWCALMIAACGGLAGMAYFKKQGK